MYGKFPPDVVSFSHGIIDSILSCIVLTGKFPFAPFVDVGAQI
jgi:hypothetical protein